MFNQFPRFHLLIEGLKVKNVLKKPKHRVGPNSSFISEEEDEKNSMIQIQQVYLFTTGDDEDDDDDLS